MAELLGKTRRDVEEMLTKQDVIELNLNERKIKHMEENDEFKIYEP